MSRSLTFLCVSTFFKGNEFLKSCKLAGNTVFLLTDQKLEHKPWVREYLDEVFYVNPDGQGNLNLDDVVTGLAYVMRSRPIDRIVALDDFDVEKAAYLRECFRIPGMGQTTVRHFRDKLAMRVKAAEAGLRCPTFSDLFTDEAITRFADTVTFPAVVKPRGEASTTGIRKVWSADELWQVVHGLGDRRHQFLVEQFKPGDVYHVDALTLDGEVIFQQASQYLSTPMEVAHGGGIFRSVTVPYDSDDDRQLKLHNEHLLKAFGLRYSASHSEFIKCHEDGEIYFLETASRVGGANLAEMVEAASGVNLWREWARIETAVARGEQYHLPPVSQDYSGILISLINQEIPEMSTYQEAEIWWKMNEPHHIGLIVRDPSRERVLELLDDFARRVYAEGHASAPVPGRSAH